MLCDCFHGDCRLEEKVRTSAEKINLKDCHSQRRKIFNEKNTEETIYEAKLFYQKL